MTPEEVKIEADKADRAAVVFKKAFGDLFTTQILTLSDTLGCNVAVLSPHGATGNARIEVNLHGWRWLRDALLELASYRDGAILYKWQVIADSRVVYNMILQTTDHTEVRRLFRKATSQEAKSTQLLGAFDLSETPVEIKPKAPVKARPAGDVAWTATYQLDNGDKVTFDFLGTASVADAAAITFEQAHGRKIVSVERKPAGDCAFAKTYVWEVSARKGEEVKNLTRHLYTDDMEFALWMLRGDMPGWKVTSLRLVEPKLEAAAPPPPSFTWVVNWMCPATGHLAGVVRDYPSADIEEVARQAAAEIEKDGRVLVGVYLR